VLPFFTAGRPSWPYNLPSRFVIQTYYERIGCRSDKRIGIQENSNGDVSWYGFIYLLFESFVLVYHYVPVAVTLFSRVFIRYYEAIEIPRDDVWIFRSVIKTVKFKEVPDSLNWFMIIGHYTTQCFGYIGLYIIYILDYNRYIGLYYPIFLIYWIVLGIIIEKTLWTLWTSIMTEGFRVHGWFSSWNIRIKIDDLGIPLF